MIVDPNKVSDGFASLERGMDSGGNPSLLAHNQAAYAENITFRRGYAATRPGFRRINILPGADASALVGALFQGAEFYEDSAGRGRIMVMTGGRLFSVSVTGDKAGVSDASIPGDTNPANVQSAYMTQADNYMIVQDGLSRPIIYDGATARRAGADEVPTGSGPMAYGMGRLWVAQGREYVAGDIAGGPTGVLKFTENDYLAEGGSFAVPLHSGPITAMRFTSALNTALGQGELLVFTPDAVYSTVVPTDRTVWKELSDPVQRIALINYGALGHFSTEPVNGDVFFRARDGIRSLVLAIRDFTMPGATSLSREVGRILDYDTPSLTQFSSASLFDNRLLLTATPAMRAGRGVAFGGLIALDFDLLSSMGTKSPAAYDGVWKLSVTRGGATVPVEFLRLVKGRFDGVERCFAFCTAGSGLLELWEVTARDRFDTDIADDGVLVDSRIRAVLETGSYNFNQIGASKMLESADLWVDRVAGTVDFDLDFRPDQHPCWVDWRGWQVCGNYKDCGPSTNCEPVTYEEQYRPRMRVSQPPDAIEPGANKPYRLGWEFQARIAWTGHARLKMLRLNAYATQEEPFADVSALEPCQTITCTC